MIVTLIGMPAAGKTCMGKKLAKMLGMKQLDGDKLIESVTGRKLQDIIDNDGLEAFKKIEEEVLLSIKDDNVIVSTGGSAIYYDSVMQHFKSRGPVLYICVGVDILIKRLGDFSKRGVVLAEGQTIYDLYNERVPLLEKYADITINCNGSAFAKYQKEAVDKINAISKKYR